MNRSLSLYTYFPNHEDNRMKNEGDVTLARSNFLRFRPRNLANLLEQRYSWMREWIKGGQVAIELGSGHGLIREFIKDRNLVLTDVTDVDYIDRKVDALNLPFEANSVDVFICSHMIHHVAHPLAFLKSLAKCLKPNGIVIIQEIHTSIFMRLMLRIMRHEGWSYGINVFDQKVICNDPRDPWSANCAIPDLLFADSKKFERNAPEYQVVLNEYCECLAFPLSGGVIAKSKTIELPWPLLKVINFADRILVKASPKLFALGRSVVLKKVAS